MKRLIAILFGCMASVLVIFLSQGISQNLHSTPSNIVISDKTHIDDFMLNAPFILLLIIQLGAFFGAFLGGMISSSIMKTTDKIPALIVGSVLTILGMVHISITKHPQWFSISSLFIYIAGSYAGYLIYLKFKKDV